ncbi:hypothetical protein [Nocardioides gilvus]|uniref:hypothetical protein n=1 Tax=Nocardioides gilvus TaxID=1735589 RepID=UPI000D74BDB9|nr:hypothetical protein [Nocardioides gilvus]
MPHDSDSSGATASRRTVLRTAIWAVPAIQIAAAAPAFATSTPEQLTLAGVAAEWKGVNLTLSATASYSGNQTPQNLIFTFAVPAAAGSQTEMSLQTGPGADWQTVFSPGGLMVSVVRRTPILTSPVAVSLKVHVKPQRPGAITATVTTSNMGQVSGAVTPA